MCFCTECGCNIEEEALEAIEDVFNDNWDGYYDLGDTNYVTVTCPSCRERIEVRFDVESRDILDVVK